ncbi:MAG: ATPase, T2SS/T4P/T4SS family, partial [Oscillospiraceae bacterium]
MALLPIGQILVENGVLTDEELEKALIIQKESEGKKLGDVLIEQGFITEEDFMQAFSKKLMVDFVHLKDYDIDEDAVAILGEELTVSKNLLAIKVEGNQLTIATDSPLDFYQFDNIRLSTGYEVKPVLATRSDITAAIRNIFSLQETQEVLDQVNTDFDVTTIADLDKEIEGLNDKIDSAPVVKLANTLIFEAYRNGVSDIHIEPSQNQTRIRVRIDGDLVEQMKISKAAHNALITRLKIMSDLNIAEKRVPQDGRCGFLIDKTKLDLRVSTLPTIDGEKMVIRLLGSSIQQVTKLSMLGMCERDFRVFNEMLKNPNGVIMVTGPTGSGKTTTL